MTLVRLTGAKSFRHHLVSQHVGEWVASSLLAKGRLAEATEVGYPSLICTKQVEAVRQYASFLFPAPVFIGLPRDLNLLMDPQGVTFGTGHYLVCLPHWITLGWCQQWKQDKLPPIQETEGWQSHVREEERSEVVLVRLGRRFETPRLFLSVLLRRGTPPPKTKAVPAPKEKRGEKKEEGGGKEAGGGGEEGGGGGGQRSPGGDHRPRPTRGRGRGGHSHRCLHPQERGCLGEIAKQPQALGAGAPPHLRYGRSRGSTAPKGAQGQDPPTLQTKPTNPRTNPQENPQPNQSTPTNPPNPPTATQPGPLWDPEIGSREVKDVNNGPNGQGHEPRRPMGTFYVSLCLCREVSFLESWIKFSWVKL